MLLCDGDFKLDLLQYNHYVTTQEFNEYLFSHAFLPLKSNPIRLTSHFATLIENISTIIFQHVFTGIVLMIYLIIYAFSSPINYKHNPKMLPCLSYVCWAKLEPINNWSKWLWANSHSCIY